MKIMIAGAGGAPTENVVQSWLESSKKETIIGFGSEISDLMISKTEKKYLVPYAVEKNYKEKLLKIIKIEKPDMIHFQNDIEILEASKFRDEILNLGVKLYMPDHEVIENCVDKYKSNKIWEKNNIIVPETILINNYEDLEKAFDLLIKNNKKIWLRANVGGGGKGALPTDNIKFAKLWLDRFDGWGEFSVSSLLTPDSITFLSIWYKGELIVAQTRKRKSWNFGNRTLSGITGITRVGETVSDNTVTDIALKTVKAIDAKPHGIYGVDLTYDFKGIPNPTEINISRFFTTVYFFTKAGLNMPDIFKNICLYDEFPELKNKINPLKDGLLWIRGMDRLPLLTDEKSMKENIIL